MTTESESSNGSSDEMDGHTKSDRNGSDPIAAPPKRKRMETTKIVQIANIAPQTTKEQMQALFSFVGKMDDIRLYPSMDIGMQLSSKICFIKFYDSSSVSVAQHLTNTVFIDRALVVIPFMEHEIPDEQRGLELLTSGTLLPGIADPKLPQHVTSQLEGIPPNQVVGTYDPKLSEARLPKYPPLPTAFDARKIEEIRRTILIANVDSELSSQFIVDHFNQCGEVKYCRLCARDNDPLSYALIEFTEQPSILAALSQNGIKLGSRNIKVFHATQAVVKPQAKTNEAAQKEVEDAMLRQAQTIMSQGIDVSNVTTPHLGAPVIKEKRRSRSRHRDRSRDRRRSRSRSSRRRRSRSSSHRREHRHRSRSRDRERVRRDFYRGRSPSGSPRRRSRSREDRKRRASSSKKHDKKRERDEKRDRGKDEKKDRGDKEDKRDREDRKDRDKEGRKERRSEKDRDKGKDRGNREEKSRSSRDREGTVEMKEEINQNGNE